jgi:hypothetical protein
VARPSPPIVNAVRRRRDATQRPMIVQAAGAANLFAADVPVNVVNDEVPAHPPMTQRVGMHDARCPAPTTRQTCTTFGSECAQSKDSFGSSTTTIRAYAGEISASAIAGTRHRCDCRRRGSAVGVSSH